MGVFTREPKVEQIVAEIRKVATRLDEVEGKLSARSEELALTEDVARLTRERDKLEADLASVREKHSRETREIEHKIGLHKKQVEHEITVAKKETELQVREENLSAEQDRFKQEMEFMRGRFEDEVKAQRVLLDQILSRLPTVNVERSYRTVEHIGAQPELESGDAE